MALSAGFVGFFDDGSVINCQHNYIKKNIDTLFTKKSFVAHQVFDASAFK
jgi:hypothetical protein